MLCLAPAGFWQFYENPRAIYLKVINNPELLTHQQQIGTKPDAHSREGHPNSSNAHDHMIFLIQQHHADVHARVTVSTNVRDFGPMPTVNVSGLEDCFAVKCSVEELFADHNYHWCVIFERQAGRRNKIPAGEVFRVPVPAGLGREEKVRAVVHNHGRWYVHIVQ